MSLVVMDGAGSVKELCNVNLSHPIQTLFCGREGVGSPGTVERYIEKITVNSPAPCPQK